MVANDLQIYLQVMRLFFRFVFPESAIQSVLHMDTWNIFTVLNILG